MSTSAGQVTTTGYTLHAAQQTQDQIGAAGRRGPFTDIAAVHGARWADQQGSGAAVGQGTRGPAGT